MAAKKNFRVVIVGGSIAGLTLAHSLQRCGIDFVVLEAGDDIAPQVGASIGIFANGARVFDQLGIFNRVLEETIPVNTVYYRTESGKLITKDEGRIFEERHGYPLTFLDRQLLLEILFTHLGDDQDRVHLHKRVVRVDNLPSKAVAHCADGSVFEGDLIVGADGVRSTVRQEMWRHMESLGLIKEAAKEKATMTAEYSCVFGISTGIPGVNPGDAHRTYATGYSILTVGGKGGRVYWFLFAKMDQSYSGSDFPRFNDQDLERHVAKYMNALVTPTASFYDVYKTVESKAYLCLEEAFYHRWSMDRCVCIGDSMHKMTPNIGQGGNAAIETAASLANCLARLTEASGADSISLQRINADLQNWQKARQTGAKEILILANKVTRLESSATLKDTIISQYLLPYLTDYMTDVLSRILVKGEILQFLPLPPRAVQGSMPYVRHCDQIDTQFGSLMKRALFCIPFLGLFAYANISMESRLWKAFPVTLPVPQQGFWTAKVPILDQLRGPFTCFLPSISVSHPQSYAHMLSFLTNVGPVYTIWLLESYRKRHSWTEIALAVALGTAFQCRGIGLLAPLHFTIEHLRTPLATLLHSRHKITPYILGSFLPALIAGSYVLIFANYVPQTVALRRYFHAIWHLLPIIMPLLQIPFRRLERLVSPATQQPEQREEDAKRNSTRNLRSIRFLSLSLALLSGLTFIHTRHTPPGVSMTYDETIAMASGLVWLGMKFRELKQLGYPVWWGTVIATLAGTTATLGPGAAILLGWGWREEILATLSTQSEGN
ncbi:FAD/NAD(P)-binding domain-containing protein [Aspergillus coremiiformis]|uniref:FAD/NAD(P)-binding domain-containing protein n=1 Tax=Aspergillus coremiiformis TaxID=138285 RepID=A0A5N6Z2Q9_9EURO|nr:FAD/NAD(P)-binding domain-containing protein [Aspergillus coremiiformis]